MKKKIENADSYLPTKAEERILRASLIEGNRLLNQKEFCKKAGVSDETFARAKRKPGFVKLYRELCLQELAGGMGPFTKALEKEARRGSIRHLELALEMTGLFQPKTKVEHSGSGAVLLITNVKEDEEK